MKQLAAIFALAAEFSDLENLEMPLHFNPQKSTARYKQKKSRKCNNAKRKIKKK